MRNLVALAAAAGLAACATNAYDDGDRGYGRYRYEGSAWNARQGDGPLRGPGVDRLDPWLSDTDEGSVVVRSGWERARDGFVDEETAERANDWFRLYADTDRDWCLTDAEIRAALTWAARDVRLGLNRRS